MPSEVTNCAAEVKHTKGLDKRPEDVIKLKEAIKTNIILGLPSRPQALGITKERLQELQREVIAEGQFLLHRTGTKAAPSTEV